MGNKKGGMIEGKEKERDTAGMNEKQIKHSPILDLDLVVLSSPKRREIFRSQ